jgi:hypothetical protein
MKIPPYFCQNNNTMARAFRPTVMVEVSRNYRGEFENNVVNGHIQLQFATYKNVKRNLKRLLNASYSNLVCVYRHRRGEWGEWFEHWSIVDGKPKIVKQGWQ